MLALFQSAGIGAGELVIIITTTASAIVTIVNAIAAGWGRKEFKEAVEVNKQKLEEIHISTNGNLSKVQEQLDSALKMISVLQQQISKERENGSKD